MSAESVAKIIGLIVMSVVMLIFSFIFSERGEGNVSLILLFIGIILALVMAAMTFTEKK